MPTTPITYAAKDLPNYLKYGAGLTEDEITTALQTLVEHGEYYDVESLPHGRVRIQRNADGVYEVSNIDKEDDDAGEIIYMRVENDDGR